MDAVLKRDQDDLREYYEARQVAELPDEKPIERGFFNRIRSFFDQ